jgi:hypothetical protein
MIDLTGQRQINAINESKLNESLTLSLGCQRPQNEIYYKFKYNDQLLRNTKTVKRLLYLLEKTSK